MPETDLRRYMLSEADCPGWDVISEAITVADSIFADRLISAFTIGSLAHGGFSPATSDVDIAFFLDEVCADDQDRMNRIASAVENQSGTSLASRLSIFWSSWEQLIDRTNHGRFPLLDKIDLLEKGIRILGIDRRLEIPRDVKEIETRQLLTESAEFILAKLATPNHESLIRNSKLLAQQDCRTVTKAVLLSARLLYTSECGGKFANNPDVAAYFAGYPDARIRNLVSAAAGWREAGALPGAAECEEQLLPGISSLYQQLATEYCRQLLALNETSLAAEMEKWLCRLSDGSKLESSDLDGNER